MITTKATFQPNCILIPESSVWNDSQGEHVDPTDCTPLMLDGDTNRGPLYTREQWESDSEPGYYRHSQELHTDAAGNEVRIDLLPDLCVVKIDEHDYWIDPTILDLASRIYGVYVFDRRRHVHCCSFEATYELHFIGSQYDYSRELTDEESEQLSNAIREGDYDSQPVTYWSVRDIDRMMANGCNSNGFLPKKGSGGYQLTGFVSVTSDDAIEEARESNNHSEL